MSSCQGCTLKIHIVLPMILEHLCFKTHWFHNQWIQIPLPVFLPRAEKKDWTTGCFCQWDKNQELRGWWNSCKVKGRELEVIFLLGSPEELCSVCEMIWLGWCYLKRTGTSLPGEDENPPFSHFLGEMYIDSAGSLYHGAVVCQTSLRAAIPGILLFCGIVQLGSASGPASGGSS